MNLKRATATSAAFGPFVNTTGVTLLSTKTITTGRIYKKGTPSAFTPASWAADTRGMYVVGISAAHNDTVGHLRISFATTGTGTYAWLPVWRDFTVVAGQAYDSVISTADRLQVHVMEGTAGYSLIGGSTAGITLAGGQTAGITLAGGQTSGYSLVGGSTSGITLAAGQTAGVTLAGGQTSGYTLAAGSVTSATLATNAINSNVFAIGTAGYSLIGGLVFTTSEIATSVWQWVDAPRTIDGTAGFTLAEGAVATSGYSLIGDAITSSVMADSALAKLFHRDLGLYAASVSGSVVKEIADNAGGASLTTADIADATVRQMFSASAGAYASAQDYSVVKQTADNAGGSALTTAAISVGVWQWAGAAGRTVDTSGITLAAGQTSGYTLAAGEISTSGITLASGQTAGITLASGQTSGYTLAAGQVSTSGITLASGQTSGYTLAAGAITSATLATSAVNASVFGVGTAGYSLIGGSTAGITLAAGQTSGYTLAAGQVATSGITLASGQTSGYSLIQGSTAGITLASGQTSGYTLAAGQAGTSGITLASGQTAGVTLAGGQTSGYTLVGGVLFTTAQIADATAKQMFSASAGAYSGAQAYSVVKQTADNAGGSALTTAAIGLGVWQHTKRLTTAAISTRVWHHATRTLTQTASAVAAAVAGSDLTITRYVDYSASITSLGDITNRSRLWWTIKERGADADSDALVMVELTSGALILNRAAATSASYGSISVTSSLHGDATLALTAAGAGVLAAAGEHEYDIKVLRSTGAVDQLTAGRVRITDTPTRALS